MTLEVDTPMTIWTDALAPDPLSLSEADALFAAIDQQVIARGNEQWLASVLRIHADERDWWIDVATAADASVSVVLRVSRRATAAHAVAALHEWRPSHGSRSRINVMCVC